MSELPPWLGATAKQRCDAGLVNQFLMDHNVTCLWTGNLIDSNVTNGAGAIGTNGLYLAQYFTTGSSQTQLGYVNQPISTTTTSGTNLAPTTISIYADAGGPTGSPLVTTTITAEYAYTNSGVTSSNTSAIYPTPCTVTPNTRYWMVVAATASTGQFTWFQSSATSGAMTSPDGVTWTAQAYGFRYRQSDQTVTGSLTCTYEDNGARWTSYIYNTNGTISKYNEFTDCQGTGNNYVQSCRAYTYSNGLLTSIS